MKYLSLALLIVIAIELNVWVARRSRSSAPEPPIVDLTLLNDRVTIDVLSQMQTEMDRDDPEHWRLLGETYLSFGYYPQAEMCFRVARQMVPENADLVLLQAISLDRMGYKSEAMALYREATQRGATEAESYRIRIAQCLLAEGNDDAAVDELKQLGPLLSARLLLARILTRRGQIDEAERILEPLQREYPDGVEPNSLLSWAAEERGDWEAAERYQSLALRSRGNVFRSRLIRDEDQRRRKQHSNIVFYDRSLQLEATGQIEEARQASLQAVLAMWEEDMILSYALFEIHQENPEPAITALQDVIDRVGGSAATWAAFGDALVVAGEKTRARNAWLRSNEIQAAPFTHEKLALSFDATGDAEEAAHHKGLADYERGKAAWLSNELADAETFFRSATAQATRHAPSWYYLGEVLRIKGELVAAKAAYETCLKLDSQHGRAWRALQCIVAGAKRSDAPEGSARS